MTYDDRLGAHRKFSGSIFLLAIVGIWARRILSDWRQLSVRLLTFSRGDGDVYAALLVELRVFLVRALLSINL